MRFQMIFLYLHLKHTHRHTHTPPQLSPILWVFDNSVPAARKGRSVWRPFFLLIRFNFPSLHLARNLSSDVLSIFCVLGCCCFFFLQGVSGRRASRRDRKAYRQQRVCSPSRLRSLQRAEPRSPSAPCSLLIQAQPSAAFWMISDFAVKGDSWIIMF